MKKITLIIPIILVLFLSSKFGISQTASPASSSSSKHESLTKHEIYVTNLISTADVTDIENTFKSRPGIIDAIANKTTHKVTVYTEPTILETDVWEVVKFMNRKVITEKEVSKYY